MTQIYDAAGSLQVVVYTYDSWGKVLSMKDAAGNDITSDTNMETYLGLMYLLIVIIILLCYMIQMALMDSGLTLGKGGKQELMRLIQVHIHKDIHMYVKTAKNMHKTDGSPHDGSSGKPPKKVLKKLKEKTGWDWNKKAKVYDKNPTIKIVNDRGDILGYITSTGKIKYYSGMGYNSFYFMPDFNIKLPSFNFSFNSIPIFRW
ncbi:MAG TPA: RHS repeat protein [Clostridiales bacterium]|nr:RHS repeat protein [Clostridiales bacterium]